MDWILNSMVEQAHIAHWFVFGALILAGLNLPISEDILAILSGALASQVVPGNGFKLFAALFLGAYLSDWIAYSIGRMVGSRIWRIPLLRRLFKKERVDRITAYYERYGFATLAIGRFIPFGVRNCLFFTSGMVKLDFGRFLLADGIGCFSSLLLNFSIGYFFATHYEAIRSSINLLDIGIVLLSLLAIFLFICYKRRKRRGVAPSER